MFELAIKWGLRNDRSNPVKGVHHYKSEPMERYLSLQEIQDLADALEQMNPKRPMFVALIRLLLLTGARLSEIRTLEWEFVDLDKKVLNLPDSKTGKKTIWLNEDDCEVIKGIPRIEGNPFVIVGLKENSCLVGTGKQWAELLRTAGIKSARKHDLRHTFASVGVQNGISLQEVGELLGHRNSITTQRYAHLAKDQIAASNNKIGSFINDYCPFHF